MALFSLRRKIEFGVCKKFENFVIFNFLFTKFSYIQKRQLKEL